ncbi:TAF1D polymerase, partial [Atractosteus spatula]|nr:TAF1D polymerase [Atractosteus spatula]
MAASDSDVTYVSDMENPAEHSQDGIVPETEEIVMDTEPELGAISGMMPCHTRDNGAAESTTCVTSAPQKPPAVSSDSESDDSLFQTQCSPGVLRRGRRERPQKDRDLGDGRGGTGALGGGESDERESRSPDGTLHKQRALHKRPAKTSPRPKQRREKVRKVMIWKGLEFPFLGEFYRMKHLPKSKILTYEQAALGGFLKCVIKVKGRRCLSSLINSPSTVCAADGYSGLEEKRAISPTPEPEARDQSEDDHRDDVKLVDLSCFIQKRKKKKCSGSQHGDREQKGGVKERLDGAVELDSTGTEQSRSKKEKRESKRCLSEAADDFGLPPDPREKAQSKGRVSAPEAQLLDPGEQEELMAKWKKRKREKHSRESKRKNRYKNRKEAVERAENGLIIEPLIGEAQTAMRVNSGQQEAAPRDCDIAGDEAQHVSQSSSSDIGDMFAACRNAFGPRKGERSSSDACGFGELGLEGASDVLQDTTPEAVCDEKGRKKKKKRKRHKGEEASGSGPLPEPSAHTVSSENLREIRHELRTSAVGSRTTVSGRCAQNPDVALETIQVEDAEPMQVTVTKTKSDEEERKKKKKKTVREEGGDVQEPLSQRTENSDSVRSESSLAADGPDTLEQRNEGGPSDTSPRHLEMTRRMKSKDDDPDAAREEKGEKKKEKRAKRKGEGRRKAEMLSENTDGTPTGESADDPAGLSASESRGDENTVEVTVLDSRDTAELQRKKKRQKTAYSESLSEGIRADGNEIMETLRGGSVMEGTELTGNGSRWTCKMRLSKKMKRTSVGLGSRSHLSSSEDLVSSYENSREASLVTRNELSSSQEQEIEESNLSGLGLQDLNMNLANDRKQHRKHKKRKKEQKNTSPHALSLFSLNPSAAEVTQGEVCLGKQCPEVLSMADDRTTNASDEAPPDDPARTVTSKDEGVSKRRAKRKLFNVTSFDMFDASSPT